jgi:hypothetical protein
MAVARTAPKCYLCGESYNGIYANRGKHFVGDSFIMWDMDGHKCDRSGLVYFIERKDTREWLGAFGVWTRDPLNAKIWRDKSKAEEVMNEKSWVGEVMPMTNHFPECEVTEHIFDNL